MARRRSGRALSRPHVAEDVARRHHARCRAGIADNRVPCGRLADPGDQTGKPLHPDRPGPGAAVHPRRQSNEHRADALLSQRYLLARPQRHLARGDDGREPHALGRFGHPRAGRHARRNPPTRGSGRPASVQARRVPDRDRRSGALHLARCSLRNQTGGRHIPGLSARNPRRRRPNYPNVARRA